MASFTGKANGNWSAEGQTTWNEAGHPAAGDAVDLGAFTIVQDIVRIPETSGSLLSLTAAAGALTVDTDNAMFHAVEGSLNVTTLTAGTKNYYGTVQLNSVSDPTHIYTVNATTISGGGSVLDIAIRISSRATITINATTIQGGAGDNAYGIFSDFTALVLTINATTIKGGAGVASCGVNAVGCVYTLSNTCRLENGTGGLALSGGTPTWTPGTAVNIKWGSVYFAQQLLDHQILDTIVNGSITGNRVDCPVAKAIDSSGNYGDPAAPLVGTIVTRTLSAANDTVAAGYYAAENLSHVDTDLAAGNIKKDTVIFGITGTLEAGAGGGAINLDKMGAM